jgi:hypothetical protein
MHKPGMVSIWFLIGLLLMVYGLIITAVSFYQYFVPPATPPVRSESTPPSGGASLYWLWAASIAGASTRPKPNDLHSKARELRCFLLQDGSLSRPC